MPSDNTPTAPKPTTSNIRTLQLNTHRSHAVLTTLFNDPLTRNFHFLLIQEPPTTWYAHKAVTDPNWHVIAPSSNLTSDHQDDSRIRSVIYVNSNLPTYSFAPIVTNSLHIAGVKLTLPHPHPPLHLISAYLPPGQAAKMELLRPILQTIGPAPTLLAMDSNLHHPIWNPTDYDHTHREAHDLIQLMSDHGLLLRSEPGVPTHFSNNRQGSKTTIDLQWHSPACYEWATVCMTDSSLTHSHFSDHAAIITELTVTDPDLNIAPSRERFNWAKADWPTFTLSVAPRLQHISTTQPSSLNSQASIDNLALQIKQAITQSQHETLPIVTLNHRARRWWNAEVLNPLKGNALNLRRKAQRSNVRADKVAYRAAQAAFQKAVKDAKRQHWHRFLENLTDKDLFTAAKYCDGPSESRLLPPLRQPNGSLSDSPDIQAELLFQATGGPTIPCDLSDVGALTTPSSPPDPFTVDDVILRIKKLKMGKAPGADGITAQVLLNCGPHLATCLVLLLNCSLASGFYPTQWKTANTIILKKPGKPDYHDPAAYRPIALLSTLSKLLEGTIADRMQRYAEANNCLPEGHYGGRARRSTTDALLNLTVWTKNQWALGKVVGALFVDVKAAFPTVDPTRLTHTLDKLGYCPSLTRLITNFLSQRKTTFQLGDYRSEPKQLTIGLPQGSPLSVILYILYNSSLLRQVEGSESSIAMGFIDDVAFLTARDSHQEVKTTLQDLATKELLWGTKHGAAFDRQKSQWMVLSHKKPPETHLSLRLGDTVITPQPQIKWLGVLIDSKLTFSAHIKSQAAKGLKVANKLASLARTGWGIPLPMCKRLISSLIFTRTDYACVVWHKTSASPSASAAIQRVDNTAHRFTLGTFKSQPVDFLLHDTNSLKAKDRLDCKANAAIARLLTLPMSNPAGLLSTQVFNQRRNRHLSTLHHTFQAASGMWSNLPTRVEVIDPHHRPPQPAKRVTSAISSSREESHEFVLSNTTPTPPHTFVVCCDGASQVDGTAAAALDNQGLSLRLRLGAQAFYTAHDGELASVLLALLLARDAPQDTSFVWILNDNQTVINEITDPPPPKTGQHLRQLIARELHRLLDRLPNATVAFIWCAKGSGLEAHSAVDTLAKETTKLATVSDLPISHPALQAQIRLQERRRPTPDEVDPAILRRLHHTYQPLDTFKALSRLRRSDATIVTQLRSGHCPLNSYLHCFKVADTPNCSLCRQPESVEHFLLTCRKFAGLRRRLLAAASKTKTPRSRQAILANPALYQALADFGRKSFRFYKSRYPKNGPTPPIAQPTTRQDQDPER